MTKVLTFSRTFPAFHPKAGEPTYFVEKLTKGFPEYSAEDFTPIKGDLRKDLFSLIPLALDLWTSFHPKYHTIRAGHNWKVGDMFSPRVWSGKPYNSPQITIAPDIRVEKVWKFEIKIYTHPELVAPQAAAYIEDVPVIGNKYFELAKNDGLSHVDLIHWIQPKGIPTEFSGQIICWNKNIEY